MKWLQVIVSKNFKIIETLNNTIEYFQRKFNFTINVSDFTEFLLSYIILFFTVNIAQLIYLIEVYRIVSKRFYL